MERVLSRPGIWPSDESNDVNGKLKWGFSFKAVPLKSKAGELISLLLRNVSKAPEEVSWIKAGESLVCRAGPSSAWSILLTFVTSSMRAFWSRCMNMTVSMSSRWPWRRSSISGPGSSKTVLEFALFALGFLFEGLEQELVGEVVTISATVVGGIGSVDWMGSVGGVDVTAATPALSGIVSRIVPGKDDITGNAWDLSMDMLFSESEGSSSRAAVVGTSLSFVLRLSRALLRGVTAAFRLMRPRSWIWLYLNKRCLNSQIWISWSALEVIERG